MVDLVQEEERRSNQSLYSRWMVGGEGEGGE